MRIEQQLLETLGGEAGLLRDVDQGIHRMICRYLSGCFGQDFSEGEFGVDGFLAVGDYVSLVEVVPLSEDAFSEAIGIVPASVAAGIAAKIRRSGADDAVIIVFDRNKSDWCAYRISGNPYRVRVETSLISQLDGWLWSLNRKSTGRHTACIHPSEFSTTDCDRQIAYGLLGTQEIGRIPANLRRIFDVGHVFHDVIQKALSETLEGFQPEVPIRIEDLRIRGSCDGGWGKTGFEIKSIGRKGFGKLSGAKPEHQRQATIYGIALSMDEILYLYANKETGQIAAYSAPPNRHVWQRLAARAMRIIKTVESGQLPPPVDKDYDCRSCKYAWTCKPHLVKS
jgi:hypothetical protein